jgi:hypothetical protein
VPNYSGYSDLALLKLIGAQPEHMTDEYLHHIATAPDKQFKKQATDTRTFQQYDNNNATAQRQIGSSAAGVMLPNNPYRAEAEQTVVDNVAQAMTDPMLGNIKILKKGGLNYQNLGNGTFDVKDTNNKQIGVANVVDDGLGDYLTSVRVDKDRQREKIATNLYDFIESEIQKPLRPSPRYQTPDSIAFWRKRGTSE